ncbi:Alpha/Beta hydrolase protein [Trichoderma barbatum]
MRLAAVIITSLFSAVLAKGSRHALPAIHLGYEIHQAISLIRTTIQRGDVGASCPQAYAVWYLCGLAQLSGTINSTDQYNKSLISPPNPLEREDCLFLDVIIPKAIFDDKNNRNSPVLVWVYGGGFAFGHKGGDGALDPEGRGGIYVQFTIEPGAFGFLSGPNLQANGTANAGLLDQRMALDWVQQNNHLFGGDANRVTAFGQSAGVGSIMRQIIAYGGLRSNGHFSKQFCSRPDFPSEARRLPYETLYAANVEMVAASPQGTFTWAPAPDGDFVPALPGSLLLQGSYDKSVKIMTGFNTHETLYFTAADNTNDSVFVNNLAATFLGSQPSIIDYTVETLYPAMFYGSEPYTDFSPPASLAQAEAAFAYNTEYLQKAFRQISPSTYGYRFSIPPSYHGKDVSYTFYNGPSSSQKAKHGFFLR